MRFNPAPLLFLPGILLIGYWIGSIPGLITAAGTSLVVIVLATIFHWGNSRLYQRGDRLESDDWAEEPVVVSPEISG